MRPRSRVPGYPSGYPPVSLRAPCVTAGPLRGPKARDDDSSPPPPRTFHRSSLSIVKSLGIEEIAIPEPSIALMLLTVLAMGSRRRRAPELAFGRRLII